MVSFLYRIYTMKKLKSKVIKFTLIIPAEWGPIINHLKKQETGFMSRNTWIMKAIKKEMNQC